LLKHGLPVLSLLFLVSCAQPVEPPEITDEWAMAIAEFRAEREERLRSNTGWLTLAGLHWLRPGENRLGSDPDTPVVLAADGVPAWAGTLVLEDETVTLRAAPGVEITLEDEPVAERVLRDDAEGQPDVLAVGRMRFHVIRRDDKFGVRVKDTEHPDLIGFRGLDYFLLDPDYRFDAAFEPYDEPREVEITTVTGTRVTILAPGRVTFTLDGRGHSLQAFVSEPGETELWFIFKDETSGRETYGFRFLYADLAGDRVDLDFNRAYNPPCAFTPYATCPLPPRENRLDARIEAGERAYGHPSPSERSGLDRPTIPRGKMPALLPALAVGA
jgi:uncharacterized protein (DUF1684 family)